MAKIKKTRKTSPRDEMYFPDRPKGFGDPISNFFARVVEAVSPSDPRKQLDVVEWVVFIGVVALTLVMPFLYSRATTENFLTPKEFVSKITLAILGAVFCVRFIFYRQIKLVRTRFDLPLVLFFGFSILSVLWNYNAWSAVRDLRGTLLILLLFPLIVNTFKNRWQIEMLLWVMVIAAIGTGMLGIMESYNMYYRYDQELGWVSAREEIFNQGVRPDAYYLPLFPQLANKEQSMGSIVSTFGNRNYLGTFLMFCSFIPLSMFFYYRSLLMKILSFGLCGGIVAECHRLFEDRTLGLPEVCVGFLKIAGMGGFMLVMLLLHFFGSEFFKSHEFMVFTLSLPGGIFGLIAFALYRTRCRAAVIGLAAGLCYMLLMLFLCDRNWQFLKKNALFFLAVVLVGAVGFLFAVVPEGSDNLASRLKSSFNLYRSPISNIYERVWVWYATSQAWEGNPLRWIVGKGYGSYKHFFPLDGARTFSDDNKETFTAVTFRQAHNDWLQLMSELGIIGFGLFLFIPHRFFIGIYNAIRADVWSNNRGSLGPDHLILIGLGAAMASQLVAAVPDFPFHRIETAFYAVVALAVVPLFTEGRFFSSPPSQSMVKLSASFAAVVGAFFIVSGVLAVVHENRSWRADILVREADQKLRSKNPEDIMKAKGALEEAMRLDPLPGDPYLKYSSILAMKNKPEQALEFANKAWQNINFNARSTYHSVVFRRMHILYHIMGDREAALKEAELGQYLTAGDARAVYYFYIGKIAYELQQLEKAEWALERALRFDQFKLQATANLAVVKAGSQKWQEAMDLAASASLAVNNSDPTMLNIIGVSASNLGQNEKAEAALRKAIQLSPDQPVFKRDLGIVLLRSNRIGEAREHLEAAYLAPNVPQNVKEDTRGMLASVTLQMFMIGNHLAEHGRNEEAVQAFRILHLSKTIEPSLKKQVEEKLKALGAFQAEAY